jgi:hypothetical protein
MNPYKHCNLDTESGRKKFEEEVARFMKLYPGALVPEGQEFDFKNFYTMNAIIRDASSKESLAKHNKADVDKLKADLQNFLDQ